MPNDELYEQFDKLDSDELCNFCKYSSECGGSGVHGGPNGPVYPPCAGSEPDEWFDFDSFAESLENEGDVE